MTQIIHQWVPSATTQNILYTSEFLLAMQFPTTCCGVMQGKFGKGTLDDKEGILDDKGWA